MLKPLLLLATLTHFCNIYGQDKLKQIVNDQTVPPNWEQLIIFKREWKYYGSVELKRDKVKNLKTEFNGEGVMIFSADSFKLRPSSPAAISDFMVDYQRDQKTFLATATVKSGKAISPVYQANRVYALDSSYLVIEWIQDYSSVLKQTNGQLKPEDSINTNPKIVGAPSFTFKLPVPVYKSILFIYRAEY